MGVNPGWKLLASVLLNARRHLRLHQTTGALRHQLVQADTVDDIQRVQHVTLGFGHFMAILVAHQAMDVNLTKGDITHEFDAHHDHPRHPEENDVKASDQHAGGIEGLECSGLLRPAQRRKRP